MKKQLINALKKVKQLDELDVAALEGILKGVRQGRFTVKRAKRLLELAGIVEIKGVHKSKKIDKTLMDLADEKTVFIIEGE